MARPRKPGSGGPRTGTPGQAYPNRSDLRGTQGVRVATGQPYGQAGQQSAAEQAMPLPQQPGPPPAGTPSTPAGSGGPLPGALGPLHAPTNRPNEPLTAGLPTGAGPGPEALNSATDPTLAQLRGIYAKYPNPAVMELISEAMAKGAT